jgi:hypothetical protein
MLEIVFILCVVGAAVTIAIDLRDERRKTRKIAELEAALQEKNVLLQQKTTV